MSDAGSLTPNDLRNQVFKSKMRGYDPLEVDAVLEETAAQWETLIGENLRLREQNSSISEQSKKYTDLEQTLRDTLVVAEKAAEERVAAARKETEVILEKARLQAESITRDAEARLGDHRQQIGELQATRDRLKAELEGLLHTFQVQLQRFGDIPERETTPAKPVESVSVPRAESVAAPRPAASTAPGSEAEEMPLPDDDRAADFDDALSKIFGGEPDAPVPPKNAQFAGRENSSTKVKSDTPDTENDKGPENRA